jgi:SHS2 domain-containing protein
MAKFEIFSHTADIGVRGRGKTIEEAFIMAAMAMTSVVTEPESIDPNVTVEISCEAENLEFLLYDWLNSIIFEMSTRKMLFCEFDIVITDHSLSGMIRGEKVDPDKHDPTVEIKGATLTELKVKKNGEWIAQCILDV